MSADTDAGTSRICTICGEAKPLERFEVNKANGTRRRQCRSCKIARENVRKKAARAAGPVSSGSRRGIRTILVFGDVHVPEHDRGAWACVLAWARANRVDEVIINGDFGEFASVSSHGGAQLLESLARDFTDVKQALDDLRAAVGPGCVITYNEGNHETRLRRFLLDNAPTLMDSLSLEAGLGLAERGIAWVPEYRQPVRRGKLSVVHGHQFMNGWGGMYFSRKLADTFALDPGSVVICGHTHRAQAFSRAVAGGEIRGIGLACLRTLGPEAVRWLQGREAGWTHQFAVAYLMPSGAAHVYPVDVRHGQCVWAGRVYGEPSL